MRKEILSPEQKSLIPVLRSFSELGFFLVGGTAIALFLAHRRSIDFDLFICKPYKKETIINKLLDLASMKAYALGRRAKWKDYVDLYFILKGHATLNQLAQNADRIFGGMFNEKLFREQLSYFEDIDYSEKIDYLPGKSVADISIREFLVMKATEKM